MKKLQLVIDSNVYILSFGFIKEPHCEELISLISEQTSLYTVRILSSIIEEIRRHLVPEDFQKFIRAINLLTNIDEDFLIPFPLGVKYEAKGLKPADALIAAYAEWAGADVLVTENRHFLSRHKSLPFRVLNAKDCLKFIHSSKS